MAGRRSKSIDQVVGHRTKAEIEARKNAEDKLKSSDNLIDEVPSWLSDDAKEVYLFLIEQFKSTGILCNLDKETITICADTICKMREAQISIDKDGLIVNGKPNPMINVYEKYEKIYARMISELGLSPSARSKMALTQSQKQEKEADPILRIIKNDK